LKALDTLKYWAKMMLIPSFQSYSHCFYILLNRKAREP
jgi:hypothetical protein